MTGSFLKSHAAVLLLGFSLYCQAGKVYQVKQASDWQALPELHGGDRVVVAPGRMDGVQVVLKSGDASEVKPVVITAEEPGKSVFSGLTRIVLNGRHITLSGFVFREGGPAHKEGAVKFENGSSDCRLTNCCFDEFDQQLKDCSWVFVRGYRHRIDHCSFVGKVSKNATVFLKPNRNEKTEKGAAEPRQHRLDHNYFGPRTKVGQNGYESIRVGDSKTQGFNMACVVQENYFYRAIKADDASEMEVISNKSCGNIYQNNILEECDGQLTLRHGRNCVVEGNWFLGTGGARQSGVRVIGSGHIVRGNVFYNLGGSGLRAALCVMDGKYGDNVSNKYEGVENLLIEGNRFVDCFQSVNIGESKGLSDPPRGVTLVDNMIHCRKGGVVFSIEPDVAFKKSTGNQAYHANGKYGNPPKGVQVGPFKLDMDVGKKPFQSSDVKPSFLREKVEQATFKK